MKKLLALALTVILALGALPAALAEETVTITWWAFPTFGQAEGDAAGTYEQTIIEAFEAQNPGIKVVLETIDFTSGPEKIAAAIEGKTVCDVLFDAPGRIIEYGKNGKLAPLDDLFTDEFKADVGNEALINACAGDGTFYMYPLSSAPFFMAINQGYAEETGAIEFVNLEGDRTWTTADFEQFLQKLVEGGKNPGTVFCNGQGGDQGTRAFIGNLYSATLLNDGMTEYTINSENGVKALQTIVDWESQGLLGNGSAYNGGGDIELFVAGTTAFTLCWGTSTALTNAATLEQNGITALALPFPSDDGVPALEYLVNGFCVFDNGDEERIAASKKFLQFLCDDAEWGPKNVLQSGAFPVRASFGNLYEGNAEYEVYTLWTKLYAPYYNTVDGFAAMRGFWYNMLQAVQNGDVEPQAALDQFVADANATLE